MIRTFISYHHANDQAYKDAFVSWATRQRLIVDMSVSTGEIDDSLDSQSIRRIIRDDYLRDSEVTVLLCGRETRYRKHVDWELKSTMIDGSRNRRSGILVIDLPETDSDSWICCYDGESEMVYPDWSGTWQPISTITNFEQMFPDMPRRILENLNVAGVKISIVPWQRIYGHVDRARFLLDMTAVHGPNNPYNLSRPMRRKNFNPRTEFIDWRV